MIYDRLSEYYDQFVDEELLDYYLEVIQKEVSLDKTIMSLGCGTAPLAIELSLLGYFVSGSDLSSKMLERAYNNAVEAGVHLNFYVHNILDPLFQSFDCITMSSDVINYLADEEEVKQAFLNVSNNLKQDGVFMFDSLLPAFFSKMDNHSEDILLNDDVLEWTVTKTNIENQIRHEVRFGDEVEFHFQRSYTVKTIKDLLNDAGLVIIKKKKTEERAIYLCKRK